MSHYGPPPPGYPPYAAAPPGAGYGGQVGYPPVAHSYPQQAPYPHSQQQQRTDGGLYPPGSAQKMKANSPGPSGSAAGTPTADGLPAVLAKTRSVMACVLCRKQKMKCEGPDKAPCRRCKAANVECTFETAPTSAPRPRQNQSDAWVETRIYTLEERFAQLEEALAATSLAVAGPSQAIATQHERRIAQLEAQLQQLQLATGVAGFGHTLGQQPLPPGFPSLGRGVRESMIGADGHREKRARADDDVGDLIDRGLVTEAEARTCFEAYFSGYGTNATNQGAQVHLPFAATRSRSPLLLSVVTAIGARSLSRFDTFKAALDAALLEVPAPGRDVSAGELELKALVLLGVYTGNPKVLHQATMLCHQFGLPDALLEVGRMSAADKASARGQRLIVQGRTFLTCYVAMNFYSVAQSEFCQQNSFAVPADVIHRQLEVLEQSEFSMLPGDRMLRVNIEEVLILKDVWDQIGPSIRIEPLPFSHVCSTVESAIDRLRDWSRQWADAMSLITTWGDDQNLKAAIPLHHALLNVLYYIFGRNVRWDQLKPDPSTRELARLAREACLAMLRWGVESRIWLPHSMIAIYHTFINIPTSLTVLSNVSRLFPRDTPLRTIRTLLHRVLEQSNACIQLAVAPPHEVARARETKGQVLEFDRWAFELGEDDTADEAPSLSSSTLGPAKSESGASDKETTAAAQAANDGGEEESLGEEMRANLNALKFDLALWGSMLVEGPEA